MQREDGRVSLVGWIACPGGGRTAPWHEMYTTFCKNIISLPNLLVEMLRLATTQSMAMTIPLPTTSILHGLH
jgi:hypothetical protein